MEPPEDVLEEPALNRTGAAASLPLPAIMDTLPPVAPVDEPLDNTSNPLLADVELPVYSMMLPLSPLTA